MINSITEALKYLEEVKEFLERQHSIGSIVGDDFSDIITLLDSPEWPQAIVEEAINPTEQDKRERAEYALDLFDRFWGNKKFLDYGCGEGWMARIASERGSNAFGYDIEKQWEEDSNGMFFLTTDYNHITSIRSFDRIMLYDVLDHVDDPVETLNRVHALCNPHTQVFVRCHPWCSRHGGHLFKFKNKAYMHLFLNEAEQEKLGMAPQKVHKIIHPMDTYKMWIERKFNIVKSDKTVQPIEKFFYNNSILRKYIQHHWRNSPDPVARNWPEWPLSVIFCDFWLTPR